MSSLTSHFHILFPNHQGILYALPLKTISRIGPLVSTSIAITGPGLSHHPLSPRSLSQAPSLSPSFHHYLLLSNLNKAAEELSQKQIRPCHSCAHFPPAVSILLGVNLKSYIILQSYVSWMPVGALISFLTVLSLLDLCHAHCLLTAPQVFPVHFCFRTFAPALPGNDGRTPKSFSSLQSLF